jgi:electron transport complex protein RnfB
MHTVIESECTGCDLCIPPCPVDCIHVKALKPTLKTWKWHRPEGGYAAPRAS